MLVKLVGDVLKQGSHDTQEIVRAVAFESSAETDISYVKMKVCMCVCMSGGLPPDLHNQSP